MPKQPASLPARISVLPLSDWGDFFRPNPSPASPDDEIRPFFHPENDAIGHYCGHPSSPPVFRRHIGWLAGDKVTGQWDAIICPEMALRVEIPRSIKTWGELHEYLTELVGTTIRSTGPRRRQRRKR